MFPSLSSGRRETGGPQSDPSRERKPRQHGKIELQYSCGDPLPSATEARKMAAVTHSWISRLRRKETVRVYDAGKYEHYPSATEGEGVPAPLLS